MPPWSLPRRIAFRFTFVYFVGYMLPFPLGWLPGDLGRPFTAAKAHLASFTARHLLHATVAPDPMNGSGDQLFYWAEALGLVVLAALVTLLWSLVERHRPRYGRLHRVLRFCVRWYLFAAMLGYGVEKIFDNQMPVPPPIKLAEPVGDLSPMSLLWTFMGASPAYERFTGVAETLGALLVLFRRTSLLGALALVAVVGNVLALNLCYDVPVKLFLLNLMAMTLFLLAPDARRLVDLLLLGRATTALPPVVVDRRVRIAQLCLGAAALGWIGYCIVANEWEQAGASADAAAAPAWSGDWRVDDVTVDGKPVPPLLTETTRWRELTLVQYAPGFAGVVIRRMDDERLRYQIADDAATHALGFHKHDGSEPPFSLRWAVAGDQLTLDGTQDGHALAVTLHRAPARHFLLLDRRFHWVSGVPFSR